MVKVRGQNSNWNTVKQTAKIAKKISGDENAAGITSLVPGVKNLRLWNGLEFDRGVIGLLEQVAFEVIPADHEHFETLAWPCMKARWHHWRHKRSHMPFFRWLFNRLPFEFQHRTFTIALGFYRKNLSDQSLWLQFSFKTKKRHSALLKHVV